MGAVQVKVIWSLRLIRPIACFLGAGSASSSGVAGVGGEAEWCRRDGGEVVKARRGRERMEVEGRGEWSRVRVVRASWRCSCCTNIRSNWTGLEEELSQPSSFDDERKRIGQHDWGAHRRKSLARFCSQPRQDTAAQSCPVRTVVIDPGLY